MNDLTDDKIAMLVQELKTLYQGKYGSDGPVENTPVTNARIESGICVWCEKPIEPGQTKRRGCHANCYRTVDRRVKAGEYKSDDDAVRQGAWAVKEKVGPKFRPRPTTVDDRATEINDANQVSKRRKPASENESKQADQDQD